MSTQAILIVLAVGFACGVTLLAAAFVPSRPRLGDVLTDRRTPTGVGPIARTAFTLVERTGMRIPVSDLNLVGQSQQSFLLQRMTFMLGGALWAPLLALLLAVVQIPPPPLLTGVASLAAAAFGWTLPVSVLKTRARQARAAFAGAVASYCHLVALGRLGDRGPVEALRYPASLGGGWAFRQIQAALDEAALRGQMPWEGLEQLANDTGVRELKDLGHIVTTAGQGGASIVDTLRAKAASVTGQQLAAQKTGSSVRSDRMDMPIALMGMAFIVFLAFPGISTMLGG